MAKLPKIGPLKQLGPPILGKVSMASIVPVVFRKTLSSIGTKTGARQTQG